MVFSSVTCFKVCLSLFAPVLATSHSSLPSLGLVTRLASAANPYVDPEDIEAANNAKKKAQMYCLHRKGQDGSAISPAERKTLSQMGENGILHILEKGATLASGQELKSLLYPYISHSYPLIFGILLMLLWPCCCCHTCGMHCNLRCFPARERKSLHSVKLAAAVLVGFLSLGITITVFMARSGYQSAMAGLDDVACSSAQIFNSTLSGKQDSPTFIGMLPILEKIDALAKNLDDDSNFMKELRGLLDSTEPVVTAVGLATQTASLLVDVLNTDENKAPSAEGVEHINLISQYLQEEVYPSIKAVDDGIGKALANARGEVDKQLTPEKRQQFQKNLREGATPLMEAKRDITEGMKPFINDGTVFDEIKEVRSKYGYMSSIGPILEAGWLMACGILTITLFVFFEKRLGEAGNDEFNPTVHRFACFSWCSALLYISMAFFSGGLIMVVSAPLGDTCQIMKSISGDMLKDINNTLRMPDDALELLSEMVDSCVNPENMSANANILDLIPMGDEDGTRTTFRRIFAAQLEEPIELMFKALGDKLNTGIPEVATDPQVVKLRHLLQTTPIDSLIIPVWAFDPTSLLGALQFAPLVADPRGTTNGHPDRTKMYNGVQIATVTTLRCNSVLDGPPELYPSERPVGINEFVDKLSYFGTLELPNAAVDYGCARKVASCTDSSAIGQAICHAGNLYIDSKRALMGSKGYRCDLFSHEGAVCDPKDMTESGGVWSSDCLDPSTKKTTVMKRTCTLPEFVQYIKDFDTRLDKVLKRVDKVAPEVTKTINGQLRTLVKGYILDPVHEMIDGVRCGFVAQSYRGLIGGLCQQSLYGLNTIAHSYVICAWLSAILLVIMYAIWRIARDNVTTSEAITRAWGPENDRGVQLQAREQLIA